MTFVRSLLLRRYFGEESPVSNAYTRPRGGRNSGLSAASVRPPNVWRSFVLVARTPSRGGGETETTSVTDRDHARVASSYCDMTAAVPLLNTPPPPPRWPLSTPPRQ